MNYDHLLQFNLQNYKKLIKGLIETASNNSIYSGKTGAIIYLLELYELTEDAAILNWAEEIAREIYSEMQGSKSYNYAFYTGDMGVAYSFVALYRVTAKHEYYTWSKAIAQKCRVNLARQRRPVIDLLNGVSGMLLVLLHIYSLDSDAEEWILDDIRFVVDCILSNTELGKDGGVYWDKSERINQGLTGFSHGASGIGFVLYELYNLTGLNGFKELCHQAFAYEDLNFDDTNNNWLDHRKFAYTEDQERLFDTNAKLGNLSFFLEDKVMTAWCHGVPGIALSRLNNDYRGGKTGKEISKEVLKSLDYSANHSLCHSSVGNALCLLSLNSHPLKRETAESVIQDLCNVLLTYYEKNTRFISGHTDTLYDKSLFVGDLGVFYFILKAYRFLRNGDIKESVLYPVIRDSNKIGPLGNRLSVVLEDYDFQYIAGRIIENHYPKTVAFMKKCDLAFPKLEIDFEHSFVNYMCKQENEMIKDVFKFEREIRVVDKATASYSYIYFRTKADVAVLSDTVSDICMKEIASNPNHKIIRTLWNWDHQTNREWKDNIPEKKDPATFLIVQSLDRHIIKLNEFSEQLIAFLRDISTVSVGEMIDYFGNLVDTKESERLEVERIILQHIKYFAGKGVINVVHR